MVKIRGHANDKSDTSARGLGLHSRPIINRRMDERPERLGRTCAVAIFESGCRMRNNALEF